MPLMAVTAPPCNRQARPQLQAHHAVDNLSGVHVLVRACCFALQHCWLQVQSVCCITHRQGQEGCQPAGWHTSMGECWLDAPASCWQPMNPTRPLSLHSSPVQADSQPARSGLHTENVQPVVMLQLRQLCTSTQYCVWAVHHHSQPLCLPPTPHAIVPAPCQTVLAKTLCMACTPCASYRIANAGQPALLSLPSTDPWGLTPCGWQQSRAAHQQGPHLCRAMGLPSRWLRACSLLIQQLCVSFRQVWGRCAVSHGSQAQWGKCCSVRIMLQGWGFMAGCPSFCLGTN